LKDLRQLVVKPAFPTIDTDPVFGAELSAEDFEALSAKIQAHPRAYIAQERIASFRAPVLFNGEVQSRRFVVRAYLAAAGKSYMVMPGALTRVTASPESLIVSLQRGGGSKDTWILGEGPVSQVSLLAPASAPVALSRGGSDLPSRVADDLFWLARYAERAEAVVRLARCVFNRLSDPNSIESPRAMQVLMRGLVGPRAPGPGPAAARELAAEIFSADDPAGLRSSTRRLHSLARVLRDRISADAWRILQSIERDVADFDGVVGDDQIAEVVERCDKLTTSFLAFGGMAAESMTRGQSWRFLDLGLRIERGIAGARLVRATLAEEIDEEAFLLDAVLETADSSLTYRRRYATRLEVPAVVDLLITDETNPRAVSYQAVAIEEHLSHLPREWVHPQRNPDQQRALQLRTMLRLADLPALCVAADGRYGRMNALITDAIGLLNSISEFVSQNYFSHATVSPSLLSPNQEREF
jgi:uncharacterized alpha-E superfamily protein